MPRPTTRTTRNTAKRSGKGGLEKGTGKETGKAKEKGSTQQTGKQAEATTAKLIVLPKLEPPVAPRYVPKLLPKQFKSVYVKGDPDIDAAVEKQFMAAIDRFGASGKAAISDNMLPASRFSADLKKKLQAHRGKRIDSGELLEQLRQELQLNKIIPREPRLKPAKEPS